MRTRAYGKSGLAVIGVLATLALPGVSAAPNAGASARFGPHDLEGMTSPELRERMRRGITTVLVPIGGTEQNGAHMVLGKHNVRVHQLATRIATALGNTVVAPIMAYVPQGRVQPPEAHMKYTGTLSIPEPVFEAVLEGTARSFKQHGFRNVVFLGDHGGYQTSLTRVATRLNREWARDPACRVLAPPEYYRVTQTRYVDALRQQGVAAAELGRHAGLADTSLSLALDPTLVRTDKLAAPPVDGVTGQPQRSSAALGELGVRLIVEQTVAAIRRETGAR